LDKENFCTSTQLAIQPAGRFEPGACPHDDYEERLCMTEEERVPFDIEEFFDRLMEKLELAKAKNIQPVIREEPSWVIAIPQDVVKGRPTDVFTIMAKQEVNELQLHYGNTADGQFYLVTFAQVTKEDFVKSVMEIIHHIYREGATQ
jgi:hypothetical protein